MIRQKVFLFAMALALSAGAYAQASNKGYSYEYILNNEVSRSLPMESVPPIRVGSSTINPGDCFFTPELNLSDLKNPVLRVWEFGTWQMNPNPIYTILSYGDRYVSVKNPGERSMTALPAISGLRVGKNEYVELNRVFTIGEMPANREDIIIEEFEMQIVRGIQYDSTIEAEMNEESSFPEIDLRFSATGLASLDQAYVHLNLGREFNLCETLTDGGEVGQYTCSAITPDGEVPLICIADFYNESYSLLPANTQQIVLRFRFSDTGDAYVASDYFPPRFITEVVQPGYISVPVLEFEITDLTGGHNDFQSTSTTMINSEFDVNTPYDFDGDGIMEWIGSKWDYDGLKKNPLTTFNDDISNESVINADFGKVLGFTPNSENTLGYDEHSIFSVDKKFAKKEIYKTNSPRFALIDFDNNGRSDFLNLDDNTIITLDADGKPTVQTLKTMTMDDYLGIIPPGENPLGSGLSVVGSSKCPPAVFASYVQTDINGDGYPDFIDAASGNYYMNLGDGRFVTDSFGGKLLFRDFDGDGINDFLFYDSSAKTVSVTLQRISSDAVTKKLISGYNCGEDIWLRDFDKDGDVDILIPFNAKENGGMSFLVMFENDGKGSFKKKEYVIDGAVNFRKCIDWNADGNYEVVTDMYVDRDNYSVTVGKIASYPVKGLAVATTPEYIFSDLHDIRVNYNTTSWELMNVVDFNNSGKLRFLFKDFILTPPVSSNSRPQKPSSPQLSFNADSGELTVTWPKGIDNETAAADITYELRVGTAPGSDDIMCVAATADGKRRNTSRGNCGYELKRKFNTQSWPVGDIYVSLQCIDDNALGSEFSEATVFKNTQLPAQFIIESPVNVAVYEDITLKAVSNVNGLSVIWSAEGGELLSETNAEAHMLFTTAGIKTIAMTVSDGNGNSKTVTRDIEIFPVRFETIEDMPKVDWAADLDLDGIAEIHDDYHNYFHEGDRSGNYTKIKSLFNTRSYEDPFSVDINRDGLPDIIHNAGHLINSGDKSMDDMTPDNFNKSYNYLPDLDNDGFREVGYYDGWNTFVMKNGGNYADFIDIENESFSPHHIRNGQFFDSNNDGLTDVYYFSYNTNILYENMGDFNFNAHELPASIDGMAFSYIIVGDFDSNNKPDFVCRSSDQEYFILWDNNERTQLGKFETYSYISFNNLSFDLDNNGCNDLIAYFISTTTGTDAQLAILFNSDHTFSIVETEGLWLRNELPYTRSDGKPGLRDAIIHCAPNEKPSAPSDVKAIVEDDHLVVSWDMATDKETPSAALRYNLSVKHVDAEGDDSYIISPLNGGLNGVPVPNDALLINATQFPIPLMSLANGEYEIKVQAVDGRMCAGDFSAPITFMVETNGYDAPSETMVDYTIAITFNAGINLSQVNFGKDAVIERIVGQTAYVYWTSEGTKTITVGNISFTILVHPALDASFSLPDEIVGGALVYLPAHEAYEHSWTVMGYHKGISSWATITDQYERIDDKTIALRFKYDSWYKNGRRVIHTISAPYGSASYEVEISSVSFTYTPAIGIVDIDDSTGKYCVRSMDLDKDVLEYYVYKETETTNEYEYIGYLAGNDTFVDMESSPKEHTSRYVIKARLFYGESIQSQPHQPIHAMISKGLNGEWNISWNKYVGRNVSTYRILRGDNPSNMECIAEVSGNTTSYSDYDAPQTTQYYVVEILIAKPSVSRASSEELWRSRSNTVSTADVAGFDEVTVDDDRPFDIYNMQGICIKRNANQADIDRLPSDFYIINGKKIYITAR